jgi:hypothetical protein
MSGKVSGLVWELDIPHGHAWVLMSLADHAEHDGTKVFPGHSMTAWKTGYSVRQVKRICSELWHSYGLIEPVTKGGGANPTEWRVCLENFKNWKKEPPPKRGAKKGNQNAAKSGDKQTRANTTPVTSGEQTGDTHAGARRNVSIETSNSRRDAASLASADILKNPFGYYCKAADALEVTILPEDREQTAKHFKDLIRLNSPTKEELRRVVSKMLEARTAGVFWSPQKTLEIVRGNNVTPLRANQEPTRPRKRVIS